MRKSTHTLIAALLTALTLLAACSSQSAPSNNSTTSNTPLITKDANGTAIVIPAQKPMRIVSLGATDSEILGAIVNPDRVVGVDYYTDYPTTLTSKTKVSDVNGNYNVEAIIGLQPDLVLSFGGETATTDKQLEQSNINVVDLPAGDITESLLEIRLVGQLTHDTTKADALVSSMQQTITTVKSEVANLPKKTVYMEVDYSTPGKPYVFGQGSFGDQLIAIANGINIFGGNSSGGGYPQVTDEAVIAQNPQVIILTEDPNYGGNPSLVYTRQGWGNVAAVQNKSVYSIPSDLMQRPGPRIVLGLEMLAHDMYPNQVPAPTTNG